MKAFIIQARLGSTRLPHKIIRPFHGGVSILEIIIGKLKRCGNVQVILATSVNPENDLLEQIAEKTGCICFRGDENDVLERFIQAAETSGADRIIRVCSDNPFLDEAAIRQLLEASEKSHADYISFDVDGTPSIKTHFGFWTEYVTLGALKKVRELTGEKLYHEHVTNYIYAHPETFELAWLPIPNSLKGRRDIRLTIDTAEDFERAQQIYAEIGQQELSIDGIVSCLETHPEIIAGMKQEIIKNSK